MFEDEYFKKKNINTEKLKAYGFEESNNGFSYFTYIMDNQFRLDVNISQDGEVTTHVWDNETGDEYVLYKMPDAAGNFVGDIRSACGNVLADIASKCCESYIFRYEQTREIIAWVKEKYDDAPEFLWERYPDNAIWRRKDNKKWYGAILTVSRSKLGLDSKDEAEIIDIRIQPEKMQDLIDNKKYFPGWHMNKKNWYTIILDGSVPTEEICRRIDESYVIAGKK